MLRAGDEQTIVCFRVKPRQCGAQLAYVAPNAATLLISRRVVEGDRG